MQALGRILAGFLFAVSASTVQATELKMLRHLQEQTADNRSFIRAIAKQARVSAFNPPDGFWDRLNDLDTETQFILPDDGVWRSFEASDVWVFFLESPKQLPILGFYTNEIMRSAVPKEGDFSVTTFASLPEGIPGGKKDILVTYFFMNSTKKVFTE